MNNIKLGIKLIASFLLVAILSAAMGIYMMRGLDTLNDQADYIYRKGAVPLGLLTEALKETQEMRVQMREWLSARNNEQRNAVLKKIDNARDIAINAINQQISLSIKEESKVVLKSLIDACNRYAAEARRFSNEATDFDPVTGAYTRGTPPSVVKIGNEILDLTKRASEIRIGAVKETWENGDKMAKYTKEVAIVFLAVVLLFSITVGIYLTLSINSVLKTVVGTVAKIERGDMTARSGLVRGDEFGILSKSIDSLATRLQTIMRNLHTDSQSLAGASEELSSISRQLAVNAEEVASKATVVASATNKVSANINNIANTAEASSVSASNVADAVELVAASIDSMTSTAEESSVGVTEVVNEVEQVAGNINVIASAAEEASTHANQVAGAAEQMSANMNTIAAAIEEMSASISQI